jgi:hypothetical protein
MYCDSMGTGKPYVTDFWLFERRVRLEIIGVLFGEREL